MPSILQSFVTVVAYSFMKEERKMKMDKKYILSVAAITDIFGEGQKCTAAAIEYNVEIDGKFLKTSDFAVEGRTITAVYTNDASARENKQNDNRAYPIVGKNGKFVIIELDSNGEAGLTREMIGHGPHGRSVFHKASVNVSQKGDIKTEAGETYGVIDDVIVSDKTIDALADKFQEFSFDVPETDKKMYYQLYIPEDYKPTEKYPLVLFIQDAGACADETIAPLAQGIGAVIWASEEEQKKHKCFVLAPCYPTVCANDEFEVTPEADYTVELVKEISKKYPIDENRIYGTGQSMGCMMLCEINIRYPDLLGGCLLIAGQWNPKTMSVCKDKNFWIVVSQGDKKAFPIMGACMESMEKAGGKVTRGSLNAKASDEVLRVAIEKLDEEGNNMKFTWFEGESIIPDGITASHPGLHHVMTWARAYYITALRDWLFRQSLK